MRDDLRSLTGIRSQHCIKEYSQKSAAFLRGPRKLHDTFGSIRQGTDRTAKVVFHAQANIREELLDFRSEVSRAFMQAQVAHRSTMAAKGGVSALCFGGLIDPDPASFCPTLDVVAEADHVLRHGLFGNTFKSERSTSQADCMLEQACCQGKSDAGDMIDGHHQRAELASNANHDVSKASFSTFRGEILKHVSAGDDNKCGETSAPVPNRDGRAYFDDPVWEAEYLLNRHGLI